MTWRTVTGDCIEVMAGWNDDTIDAIVTDPPYGLEFMGKEWDSFRVDDRAARWSGDRSGGAGARIAEERTGAHGRVAFHRRRTTSVCRTCGRRDAFRNPHACGDEADWQTIPVDSRPIEARAFQHWVETWALEALRVLKPGGHLLAFGGTRTYHRLAAGLEDAGFEIRDCVAWLYGSGFPKSLDVSKAIDKAAGAERTELVRERTLGGSAATEPGMGALKTGERAIGQTVTVQDYAPATADAQRWQGWGTALKPAFEPVVVARKVLSEPNVAANVLRWGTGALNIDGTRLEMSEADREAIDNMGGYGQAEWDPTPAVAIEGSVDGSLKPQDSSAHPLGRWPANVALDPEAAAMLDAQTGDLKLTGGGPARKMIRGAGYRKSYVGGEEPGSEGLPGTVYGDTGGASRFFYCAKADRPERERGLEHLTRKGWAYAVPEDGGYVPPAAANGVANNHPTVKPVELMQWLVRLVTPKGGLVLDPFMGSGSTGIAALREGFDFVGVEQDPDYVEIARDRIIGDAPLFNTGEEVR